MLGDSFATNLEGSTKVDSQSSDANISSELFILVVFLAFGFVSGLVFAGLISSSSLKTFFYLKGDKFLIPRYSYWFAFSLLQLLGLTGAFFICVGQKRLTFSSYSKLRLICVALIVGLATPALRLITPLMNTNIGSEWDIIVGPLAFVITLALAMCLLTKSLRLLAAAFVWNIVFVGVAIAFVYLGVKVTDINNEWYAFVQWPILEAILALSFASWIVRRKNARNRGAIKKAISVNSPLRS